MTSCSSGLALETTPCCAFEHIGNGSQDAVRSMRPVGYRMSMAPAKPFPPPWIWNTCSLSSVPTAQRMEKTRKGQFFFLHTLVFERTLLSLHAFGYVWSGICCWQNKIDKATTLSFLTTFTCVAFASDGSYFDVVLRARLFVQRRICRHLVWLSSPRSSSDSTGRALGLPTLITLKVPRLHHSQICAQYMFNVPYGTMKHSRSAIALAETHKNHTALWPVVSLWRSPSMTIDCKG